MNSLKEQEELTRAVERRKAALRDYIALLRILEGLLESESYYNITPYLEAVRASQRRLARADGRFAELHVGRARDVSAEE